MYANKRITCYYNVFEYPFDIIFIDNPINNFDTSLLSQLNSNLGKIIMIKKNKDYLSHAIKITKNNENLCEEYLFDIFSSFELYEQKKGFEF